MALKNIKPVPTAEQYEAKYIRIHPRAVILQSLGGYTAGMEAVAKELDKKLANILLKSQLIIMPAADGTLRFVPMDRALKKSNTKQNTK